MKKIEMYAEPPFNGVEVGRDKTLEFYTAYISVISTSFSGLIFNKVIY